MNTMIISAFPACGKTYLFKNQSQLLFNSMGEKIHYSFLDSDSSKFQKSNGWEFTYVNHIEENIGTVDFIFISQHEEVLRELQFRGIPCVTVAPRNEKWMTEKERMIVKQQWFGRFILRDNTHINNLNDWINNISINYDTWTSREHLTKYNPVSFFTLKENEYLSDIIEDLYWKKEAYAERYCSKRRH